MLSSFCLFKNLNQDETPTTSKVKKILRIPTKQCNVTNMVMSHLHDKCLVQRLQSPFLSIHRVKITIIGCAVGCIWRVNSWSFVVHLNSQLHGHACIAFLLHCIIDRHCR